jgi:hypothetical protein
LAGPHDSEAGLEDRLAETSRRLAEAIEQQAATSQILAVIGGSLHDLEPVFQTVLDNAIRLCQADGALVWGLDRDVFRVVATSHITRELLEYLEFPVQVRDGLGVRVGSSSVTMVWSRPKLVFMSGIRTDSAAFMAAT